MAEGRRPARPWGMMIMAVGLWAGLSPLSALGQELTLREFFVEKHGTLQLAAPAAWRDSVKKGPRFLPPRILFSPISGSDFLVQITPGAPQMSGLSRANPAEIRKRVEESGQRLLSRALEADLTVKELAGESALGFYFSLTDRAPKPGEYRHLIQGIAIVGDLSLAFTILYNSPEAEEHRAALEMLSRARLIPSRPAQ
jgi:hypothetical protein